MALEIMNREIKPDDFVGIWSKQEGYSFLVPLGTTDKTDLPEHGIALIAVMLRLEADAEFRQECIEWLRAKTKRRS